MATGTIFGLCSTGAPLTVYNMSMNQFALKICPLSHAYMQSCIYKSGHHVSQLLSLSYNMRDNIILTGKSNTSDSTLDDEPALETV